MKNICHKCHIVIKALGVRRLHIIFCSQRQNCSSGYLLTLRDFFGIPVRRGDGCGSQASGIPNVKLKKFSSTVFSFPQETLTPKGPLLFVTPLSQLFSYPFELGFLQCILFLPVCRITGVVDQCLRCLSVSILHS